MKSPSRSFLLRWLLCAVCLPVVAASALAGAPAPKPLYRDPVYDGAADPVVIWNPAVQRWWMFYTNRRANRPELSGVAWVHGTPIGIAAGTYLLWTPSDPATLAQVLDGVADAEGLHLRVTKNGQTAEVFVGRENGSLDYWEGE